MSKFHIGDKIRWHCYESQLNLEGYIIKVLEDDDSFYKVKIQRDDDRDNTRWVPEDTIITAWSSTGETKA